MKTSGICMRQVRPRVRRSNTSAWTSAVCSDAQSPAKKPPTKAGLGLQGRPSPGEAVKGSGPTGAVCSSASGGQQLPASRHVSRPAPPSSSGIHRGPPAWRAPMDASRRRQVECPQQIRPKICLVEHSFLEHTFREAHHNDSET